MRNAALFILVLFGWVGSTVAGAHQEGNRSEQIDEGTKNFLALHSVYIKWRDGFFGSRTHYRTQLYYMLLEMMGHRIVTGYDYVFESPELVYQQKLRFAFYGDDWLHIEGKVNKESIKKIIGNDSNLLLSWWRSKKLVSVSGILRDYRIDDWQKKIYVILDDIHVKVLEK
ncbi:MAG: hypothetical protein N2316_03195 [Spirochaetes bacterium]|nr:hypothetical protein [Spirochaetota bacterium]